MHVPKNNHWISEQKTIKLHLDPSLGLTELQVYVLKLAYHSMSYFYMNITLS